MKLRILTAKVPIDVTTEVYEPIDKIDVRNATLFEGETLGSITKLIRIQRLASKRTIDDFPQEEEIYTPPHDAEWYRLETDR